jgi:DNA-binding NtrC family response regulator
VLLQGESGTGKELIARLVHRWSDRSEAPFVAVNLAAIPEELAESLLFGHEKGSFTGAHRTAPGKFELAHGGTLFLDEIGDLPLVVQGKLLRAIQEREIERLGGSRPVPLDVRVLAATNVNLRQAVRERAFREDLFYRLNVVPLHVPPLRERREDIPRLARHFVKKIARESRRDVRDVSSGALDALARYGWPGNVRELENVMERAVALARGSRVEAEDLPEEVRRVETPRAPLTGAVRPLAIVEQEYILAALASNHGNQTRTAQQLRIGSATLYRKLKAYGIPAKPPKIRRGK